jgi:hypothetical protein
VLTTGIAIAAFLTLARAQADWSRLPVAIWIGAVAAVAVGVAGGIRRWPDLPWLAGPSNWRLARTVMALRFRLESLP